MRRRISVTGRAEFIGSHCCDKQLHYRPQVDLRDGLSELGLRLKGQQAENRVGIGHMELERRGLAYALQSSE
ncbi:MAG: hypothetical protein LLF76_10300 [Planctomycetaceae bacterium]|nr:hypothetical protein [Planctomycetaceae bacterium]